MGWTPRFSAVFGFVLVTGLLLSGPASASTALEGGKPFRAADDDKRVIEFSEWSIPEGGGTATRTDTHGDYTGTWSFPLPTEIPDAGTTIKVSVKSETNKNGFDQHVRFVPSMTISGTNVKGGSVTLSADSDSDTAPSKTTTGDLELLPAAGDITVSMSDGPTYTYRYVSEADEPCSAAASFRAFPAASGCTLGALPVGQSVSIAAPAAGATANISPRKIPPETYELLLDILIEQEAERVAAALQAKFKDPAAKSTYVGCIYFFTDEVGPFSGTHFIEGTQPYLLDTTLVKACTELVLRQPTQARRGARIAARGCSAEFLPFFRKGTKVTEKMRARAAGAARRLLRASCKRKAGGGIAASLKARPKKATLNRLLGKRVGTRLALHTPSGTTRSERIGVRWVAKRKR